MALFSIRSFFVGWSVDQSVLDDDNLDISSIRRRHVDKNRMYYVREYENLPPGLEFCVVEKDQQPFNGT